MFIPFLKKKLNNPEDFNHVLITHFNLDYSKFYDTNKVPAGQYKNPEWLEKRFYLFEKYCLPTVNAQTNKNFVWFCTFHKDTPEPFMSKIKEYEKICPQMKIFFADEYLAYSKNISELIRNNTSAKKYIVTTRLDNDDGISCDYIDKIQKNLYQSHNYFIDFWYGYIYDEQNDVLYYKKSRRNPFSTRVELYDNFETIRSVPHDSIGEYGDVYTIKTEPVWLQVIHGKNILNKAEGKIVTDRKDFMERYGIKNA